MAGAIKVPELPDRPLKPWEQRAVELNAQGMSMRAIAGELDISYESVSRLFSKAVREYHSRWKKNNKDKVREHAARHRRRYPGKLVLHISFDQGDYEKLSSYAKGLGKTMIEVARVAVLEEIGL